MLVCRRKLVVPAEFSGARIESYHTVRKEVGPGTFLTQEGGRRVAYAPVQEIQLRVISPGRPGGGSARLPGVARPRVMPEFPRTRHRIELPQKASVARRICRDEPAHAKLSAGDSYDHAVAQSERCPGHRVAIAKIGDLGLPLLPPRRGIDGDEMRIQRRDEHRITQYRDSP